MNAGLAGLVLWLALSATALAAGELPYSAFKGEIQAGQIREVVIGRHTITGSRVNGEAFETSRLDDPGLIPLLESHGVRFSGAREGGWGELFWLIMLPLGLVLVVWGLLSSRASSAGNGGVMTFNKSKARLYQGVQAVTFHDVAGVPEAKEELTEVVAYLKDPDRFRSVGGRVPRGVLLVGPPGTGKTLLARALAGEAGVPFFSISGSDFVELFVGVGAARVRDLFHQAQEKAPCIVFIDELDALGKARGANPMGINDEREQALNQLLSELDGFERQGEVIVVAATNRPETLDPALLRPGRFDRQVVVDRPDLEGRYEILQVHARHIRMHERVDLRVLAARTPGMVGADLANLLNEAALLAARRGKQVVDFDDLEEATDRVVAGLARKGRILSQREKRVVSVHEIGHALVATLLPTSDPVHKVTVIPRGVAGLGFTMQRPEEERFLMRRSELLDRLCVLMGGRAAEEVVFGEITTGAHQDLQQATQLALSMVRDHGMGVRVGLVTFTQEEGMFLGGRGLSREHSEATAQVIDEEVKQLLDWAYDQTKRLLSTNRGHLLRLANLLFERETLTGEELRAAITGWQQREAA